MSLSAVWQLHTVQGEPTEQNPRHFNLLACARLQRVLKVCLRL